MYQESETSKCVANFPFILTVCLTKKFIRAGRNSFSEARLSCEFVKNVESHRAITTHDEDERLLYAPNTFVKMRMLLCT